MFDGMFGAIVTEVTIWLDGSLMFKGLGAIALGRDCCRFWAVTETDGCWDNGELRRREDERLVDANVCWTERMV